MTVNNVSFWTAAAAGLSGHTFDGIGPQATVVLDPLLLLLRPAVGRSAIAPTHWTALAVIRPVPAPFAARRPMVGPMSVISTAGIAAPSVR